MQRAIAYGLTFSGGGGGIGGGFKVDYIDENVLNCVHLELGFSFSIDSSVRNMSETIVQQIILNQPEIFNLNPKDVVIPSLERG